MQQATDDREAVSSADRSAADPRTYTNCVNIARNGVGFWQEWQARAVGVQHARSHKRDRFLDIIRNMCARVLYHSPLPNAVTTAQSTSDMTVISLETPAR